MTGNKDPQEEAPQVARDRAQQYLDIAGVILVCIDRSQAITLINKKGCELLGYEQKDLIGKNWFDLIVPEHERANIKDLFARLISGELEPAEYVENYVTTRSGQKRLVSWHNTLIRDTEGNITGTLSSGEDITDRRRVEQDLKENESRWRSILENTQAGYFFIDVEGRYQHVNDAWLRMHGYESPDEVIGHHLSISQVDADKETAQRNVEMLLAGHSIPSGEFTRRCKDGSVGYHTFSAHPVIKAGKVIGLEGFIIDMTLRKQIEKDLQDSEAKFRALYENAPVLIDGFDTDGRCTLWNDACQKVFGWTMDEINAHSEPLALFYPDPDVRKAVMDSVTVQPGNIFREWHPVTKEGEELTVLWANFQLPGGEVINVGHDISDRRRLEQEQQKVEKLESIGILAAGIAHNFNNILTVILGNISIAKMDTKPGSESHDLLAQAEEASLRAKNLTAQLLTFSKGGAPVKRLSSIGKLLQDTASFALSGTNVKCQASVPADLWQTEIDPVQVSQVIYNLTNNAQQASPAGGTVEMKAENMSLSETQARNMGLPLKPGDYIRISVTDHGAGMPEEIVNKVFDPFFTTKTKAVGLGLPTALSIVRRHGGHISVDSKIGAGSTVYVYLPVTSENGRKH